MAEAPTENLEQVHLEKADITTLDVEAFVYYARTDLVLGSGFGTAIAMRGGPAIQQELKALGPVAIGEAVLTSGGNLKARHIIHAVGPRFHEERLEEKLRATLRSILHLARERGLAHIALPALGAGFYAVPLELCADVMLSEIASHLAGETTLRRVTICVIDSREYTVFAARLGRAATGPARTPSEGGRR